ncbi:DNA topoisomerase [Lysinibacillus sphaericus]|uniref:DNA topoisomerase n=1 Tax=Lysinibacillus sphaericus TaxID=1421 RepID=UPI0018CCF74C|nr:DNA topoisomerase [Lysinibacillus sphaericus]
MRGLFIAEKPSVARDVQSVYNKMRNYPDELDFVGLVGHVCQQSMPEDYKQEWGKPWRAEVLPMIPESFTTKKIDRTLDVYNMIVNKIKNGHYDYLICGTDAGREGELIFKMFYKDAKLKIPVKRFWASDTTAETVEKALNNLIDNSSPEIQNLENAAFLRSEFDWLLGMNLSRSVTLKSNVYIPVGRVMTPTLAIVVERELAIRNFVPENFWEIEGLFEGYKGMWIHAETGERRIDKLEAAEAVIGRISDAKKAKVLSMDTSRKTSYAPGPFSLMQLQIEGSRRYGYTASEVLDIAQSLYEKHKLLTYPRTSSSFLPKSLGATITKHLEPLQYVPELANYAKAVLADPALIKQVMGKKSYVNDAKVTDHHGIIVTNVVPNLSILSEAELRIYLLVAKRLMGMFLPPLLTDVTTLMTGVNREKFVTRGKIIVDEGYTVLYPKSNNQKDDDDDDSVLPNVKEGDEVNVEGFNILTRKTTPPKRFDDASLLSAMFNAGNLVEEEELKNVMKKTEGLGTEATRATIIEKLVSLKMMERQKKIIIPSDFGIAIIQHLNGRDVVSPVLTAEWETKLLAVQNGEYSAEVFRKEMEDYITQNTTDVLANMGALSGFAANSGGGKKADGSYDNSQKEVLGKCPKCGGSVIERKAYYLCENYKNPCTVIIGKEYFKAKITKTDVKTMLKGNVSKPKKLTYGSGKTSESALKINPDGKLMAEWMN